MPPVYCLCGPGSDRAERRERMASRFAEVGVPVVLHAGVPADDPRLDVAADVAARRLIGITLGHLDMMAEFLATGAPYGVMCENDIHLRHGLRESLVQAAAAAAGAELDILLLGYLSTVPPLGMPVPNPANALPLFAYADNQWGAQMYMVSARTAAAMVATFTPAYAAASQVPGAGLTPFSPDWILTKRGRRALTYPMLAVEEGVIASDHPVHVSFHAASHAANYDPAVYTP